MRKRYLRRATEKPDKKTTNVIQTQIEHLGAASLDKRKKALKTLKKLGEKALYHLRRNRDHPILAHEIRESSRIIWTGCTGLTG